MKVADTDAGKSNSTSPFLSLPFIPLLLPHISLSPRGVAHSGVIFPFMANEDNRPLHPLTAVPSGVIICFLIDIPF